jgi:putative pyruvate formate lyase activating enzyme
MENHLKSCNICPRNCNINRYLNRGYCLADDKIIISKADIHYWEEPCICDANGVGAFFFSGCNLHCCYCQNNVISSKIKGIEISCEELADYFLKMQDRGVSSIDLVTPTHYSYHIIKALNLVKHKLEIPVVYNCSGYEKCETLRDLKDYIDIYLTDFKYFYPETAYNYSKAKDYPEIAKKALDEMVSQKGNLKFENNMLKSGVIVRHLCLPSHRHESIALIDYLGKNYNKNQIVLSLMSQFTPIVETEFSALNRHLTKMEYRSVIKKCDEFDFIGYIQQEGADKTDYIPDFEDKGILKAFLFEEGVTASP